MNNFDVVLNEGGGRYIPFFDLEKNGISIDPKNEDYILVMITDEEDTYASNVGLGWNKNAVRKGIPDRNVINSNFISKRGPVGEYVVSKGLDVSWSGKYNLDKPASHLSLNDRLKPQNNDVYGYEVRQTDHFKNGKLILHENDLDGIPYILVRSEGKYIHRIIGWCYGHEGKHDEYWKDVGYDRPCYFTPNEILRPIWTLPPSKPSVERRLNDLRKLRVLINIEKTRDEYKMPSLEDFLVRKV